MKNESEREVVEREVVNINMYIPHPVNLTWLLLSPAQ